MDKKTKRRVKGVAIFIVFLAVFTAIIQWQRREGKTVSYNFKPSQQEYRDLKFINKAQITFTSANVPKAQQEISKLMSENAKKQVRKQVEGSFGAYIFSVPQSSLPSLMESMRQFGTIASQTEQIDTSLVNIDFESETQRLVAYEREQADLNNVRFPTEVQNRRKEALHGLINTARNNLDKLKDQDNVLLYITLVPLQKNSNAFITIKNMAISFLTWLGIYAVGMVLVYFGTKLLMYFLSALGIRGLSAGDVGGSYQYGGYTGYANRYAGRYGYNNSKRKVKRVYKDKRDSEDDDSDA